MKTQKSYSKRVKVTKTGKILVRHPGINHFNAKMSRSTQLSHKRRHGIVMSEKVQQRFLQNIR